MKIFGNKKALDSDISCFFILSTGRTGTKALSLFLNNYNEIFSLHEPKPDFLRLGLGYACGKFSANIAANKITNKRRSILKNIAPKGIYIEANNRLFSLYEPLKISFKDAMFIHVIRDGRDVVSSGMNRGWFRYSEKHPRLSADNFPDDRYHKSWAKFTQFEKICWYWQKKDSMIWESMINKPNCHTLSFNRLFNETGKKGIKELIQILKLTNNNLVEDWEYSIKKKVNSNYQDTFPHYSQWTEDQTSIFNQIAGWHQNRILKKL